MSTHRITAKMDILFWFPGLPDDERESANVKLDIDFTCVPGVPGFGPEVDLVKATLIDGDGLNPTQAQVDEWAGEWLQDAGYAMASAMAQEAHHV